MKKNVNVSQLVDFTMPKGSGDKILLRSIASRLGLKISSTYKKTAIQFGTRIAKQSNIKNFGSNRKGKGTLIYENKSK